MLSVSDPTLSLDNILSATKSVKMPESLFTYSTYCLIMPFATYHSIVEKHGTGDEGRKEIFREFLSHHPYPTWEVIIKLLERLEDEKKARVGLAQEVKEKYLTSE